MTFKNYIWDEEFNLNVSRNKVRGAIQVHRIADVPSMSQNTSGTIWDINDTFYPWSAFNTAGVLVASQAVVGDNGLTVRVEGLNDDWEEVTEDFTLSSSGTITGTKIFKRVNRAYLTSGVSNTGAITFSRGGTVVAKINIGIATTLMGVYTVPLGYTAYLYKGVCSAQASADGTGFMYVRYNSTGTTFIVEHTFEVSGSSFYIYDFSFPQPIPEKSDIDLRLTTRSNNGRYTAAFDILLVDETL